MNPRRLTSPALAFSLLLAAAFSAAAPAAASDHVPAADELLERSIAYHDPGGRFLGGAHQLQIRSERADGTQRVITLTVDVPGERFEIRDPKADHEIFGSLRGTGCDFEVDGRSHLTDAERRDLRLHCQGLLRMRNYYTYLWGLPMKLQDPGTQLGEVTEAEFDGRAAWQLPVTYEAAVGGDAWYFYFDPETARLVGYRFYHDESQGDGEYILLEGELEAAGLRLPATRAWTTHQGDEYLGKDVLLAVEEVESVPAPVADETEPDDAAEEGSAEGEDGEEAEAEAENAEADDAETQDTE